MRRVLLCSAAAALTGLAGAAVAFDWWLRK